MSKPAHAIKVVFADLDGTLRNEAHTISSYTAAVLRCLKEQHGGAVRFVVATGRPFHYVFEQIEASRIPVDYIISSNGCRVHRGDDFSLVKAHDIPPRTVARLLRVNVERQNATAVTSAGGTIPEGGRCADVAKALSLSTSIFRDREWLTNYKIEGLGRSYPLHMQPSLLPNEIMESLQDSRNHDFSSSSEGSRGVNHEDAQRRLESLLNAVHMVFYHSTNENLLPVANILRSDGCFRREVDFSFSLPHIIDVYPAGVDKSSAAKEVCELLGAQPSEAIAFGDGENDITMLGIVGRGFVMSNGQDSVKNALPQA